MSTPPGGPGWYQGPDGRWYPVGPPQGPPPPYGPPPYPAPPPPRGGSTGKIVLIVLGVFVVLMVLGGVVLYQVVSGVAGRAGGLAEGSGTGCDAVSTADVDAALGGTYDVIALRGFGGIAVPVLDSRVLADAPTCWAVEADEAESGGRLARIARYSGADASQRFVAELTTAMGTTEDQGGGVSVSTSSYFNKDVQAGDEAFCTSGDFIGSAGALVRRGDLLVYVSTTAAGADGGFVPEISLDPEAGTTGGLTFATDDANCDLAVRLAENVG